MKKILILSTVAALGAVSANVQAQQQGEPAAAAAMVPQNTQAGDADGAFVIASKFSEPDGEKLYRRVCAGCHMPDAKGSQAAGFYPGLARNEKLSAAGYPAYVVVKGLNGMPAVGQMMTDKQVADVVNYVRTHFGNRYRDPITPEEVSALR